MLLKLFPNKFIIFFLKGIEPLIILYIKTYVPFFFNSSTYFFHFFGLLYLYHLFILI